MDIEQSIKNFLRKLCINLGIYDADLELSFDTDTYNTDDYNYKAIIAKDREGTSFTYNGSPTTYVGFTITKVSQEDPPLQTVTLKLTAAQTSKFEDDFEVHEIIF